MAKIRTVYFFCVVLTAPVLSFSSNGYTKSLHIAEHLRNSDIRGKFFKIPEAENLSKTVPGFVENALRGLRESRAKRTVTSPADSNLHPTNTQFSFNDSHAQMIVHWAGKDSDVIIALTKGVEIGIHSLLPGQTSHVYVSYNYGQVFSSIDDKLKLQNGSQAIISQYVNCPAFNSHYMFIDIHNNVTFTTQDYGRTVSRTLVPFKPTKILFHQRDFRYALGMDYKAGGVSGLYLTRDFGVSWTLIKDGVSSFFWEDDTYGLNASCIYILRREVGSSDIVGSVVRSCDFFQRDQVTLLSNVHDFDVQGPYMFATRKIQLLGGTGYSHQIFISHYRQRFMNALFPHTLAHLEYYVADASEDQIFLCVGHNFSRSHLYISEANSTKFSLSLEDILYFHPNGSFGDSWLKYFVDEPFADLHKVEGLRGVYIATQLINQTLGTDHQRTLISYDKGGEWQLIVAPERDVFNNPTHCYVNNNCSLHLTQTFHHLAGTGRAPPILSKESAPGLIIATGNTGNRVHIDGSAGVFLSSDAGYTWHQVLQGVHFFALADHGGVIIAVQALDPTNEIVYSTDEGETWKKYNFTTTPIKIHGLLTEPGERTTTFFLFGSAVDHHSWQVISLETKSVFSYACTDADYKQWSLPDDTPFHGCLLGRKVMIERRIPHTNCYNGKDYTRELVARNCSCTREDFECDYGYKPNGNSFITTCIEDMDMDSDIHAIPRPCPVGTFYPHSRGYAKISGDTCSGGEEHRYAPIMYACRVNEMEEFMLWTSGDKIVRSVFSGASDITLVGPDIAKNVTAIDYEYSESGCLYWADNQLHKIQKLCEGGNSSVEVLHYSHLGEVVSLAYDWKGLNIYWLDRQFRTLEVSKRNGTYRRQLIDRNFITEPNSLALDPDHGWMYWTDQINIKRAWMDGTHSSIQTILTDQMLGSGSGIVVDYISEKIYFSGSGIMSANLDGTYPVKILERSPSSYQLTSLGIHKDEIYWSYMYTYKIDHCLKTSFHSCSASSIYKSSQVSELKIFDENSQRDGNEACKNNGGCSQLCLLKPSSSEVHGKNRTCRCGENATLSAIPVGGDEDEQCCHEGGLDLNGTAKCVHTNSTCQTDQFACRNGKCISKLWTCDRDNDCDDNSDEMDCPFMTCPSGHFACGNGNCIPNSWKCDHDEDCSDASDEKNCVYATCGADKFTCGDGRCINKSWRCDFDDDCSDATDERNCTYNATVCEENEFICPTGSPHCLIREYVCDGHNHCADGADERNCSTSCPSWKLACGNNTSECVYRSWICDGDKDCSNGFDESGCTTTARPPTTVFTPSTACGFRCDNRVCIPLAYKCDGLDDCGDNSDERHCRFTASCAPNQFTCGNGDCKPLWQRCDGHSDCGDGSDEAFCNYGPTSPMPTCGVRQFMCYNSSRNCISLSSLCDGYRDCAGGEDEESCHGSTCDQSRFFKCRFSQGCLPLKSVCNEARDCPDGSDEENCNRTSGLTPSNVTCPDTHHMACRYEDKCLPYIFVCDGKMQCAHASDENLPQCFGERPRYNQVNVKADVHSAVLDWNAVPGNNVTYIVSLLYFHQNVDVYHNHTAISQTKFNLTKLLPATNYYLTVYANVSGKLQKYEVVRVTTHDDVPDVPENVHADSDSKSDLIEVTWSEPKVYKGKILHYEVCIGNTSAVNDDCQPVDGDASWLASFNGIHGQPFVKGKVYYIQVSATSSAGEGPKSPARNVTFGVDGISSYVGDLQIVPVGNNSLKISWSKPKVDADKIDRFRIQYHDQFDNLTTVYTEKDITSLTVNNLCSGTLYQFSVTACSTKLGCGTPLSTTALTNGTKVEPATSLKVDLIGPTTAKVTWDLPKGADPKENFTVFYDFIPANMYSHLLWTKAYKKFATTNSTVISDLRACEVYLFTVAVTGSGHCRPSAFATINTSPDETAAPEDLFFKRVNETAGELHWHASCLDPLPTGYITFKTEVMTGTVSQTQKYLNTTDTELMLFYRKLKRGATYNFTVKNTNKGSKMSVPLTVKISPYAAPYNLHIEPHSLNEDSGTLIWNTPPEVVPKDKFTGYEVIKCQQTEPDCTKCSNVSAFTHFNYSKTNKLEYTDLAVGFFHCFMVRLNKIDGYYGNTSAILEIPVEGAGSPDTTTPSSFIQLNKTNVIAIAVSVAVVVAALVVVLGCFIVRHRRLQRSFRAYASSHYDSSTGTTTFSAADELGEDEDSPMIRGFSDDEPLVIA